MRNNHILRIALGGVCTALVALLTLFLHIPFPMQSGYVHVGDLGIVLSALVIGPFAALPAGLGSLLADVLAGWAAYAPFTFAVKALIGLLLGKFFVRERFSMRNVFVLIGACVILIGGYFLTDWVLYGIEAAIGSVLGNCVQAAFMLVGGFVMAAVFSKFPKALLDRIRG